MSGIGGRDKVREVVTSVMGLVCKVLIVNIGGVADCTSGWAARYGIVWGECIGGVVTWN